MRRGVLKSKIIPVAVFIALEVICVVLISNNGSVQHYRIASAIRDVNNFFAEKNNNLLEFTNLRGENQKLAIENAILRGKVEALTALVDIRPDLDSSFLSTTGRFTYTTAKVINNTVNRQHNFLILDKGSEDGITEGMGVISSRGVVGVVAVCDDHFCKVKSLLDIDMRVSGKLKKDGNLGIICWRGRSVTSVDLTELPTHSDIAPGDTVITSGYSSLFPQSIPVGTIHSSKSDGVSVIASIDLFENFNSLQYVYIVKDCYMEVLKTLEDKE